LQRWRQNNRRAAFLFWPGVAIISITHGGLFVRSCVVLRPPNLRTYAIDPARAPGLLHVCRV
jgi:hypothetical protein